MVSRHVEPNVYDIKPINDKGLVHTVNWHQLLDLKKPRKIKNLMILTLLIKGYKCPIISR